METDIKNMGAMSANGVASSFHTMPGSLMSGGSEALKGGIAGLGIGIIYAGIGHFVTVMSRDPEYYKVELLTDKNGGTAKVTSLFVCDSSKYSDDEIRSLIVEKEKEKGI
jgi:hypothetical protein